MICIYVSKAIHNANPLRLDPVTIIKKKSNFEAVTYSDFSIYILIVKTTLRKRPFVFISDLALS